MLNDTNVSLACPARHMDVAVFKSEQTSGQKNGAEIKTLPVKIYKLCTGKLRFNLLKACDFHKL